MFAKFVEIPQPVLPKGVELNMTKEEADVLKGLIGMLSTDNIRSIMESKFRTFGYTASTFSALASNLYNALDNAE